jgi:hypothetical protein
MRLVGGSLPIGTELVLSLFVTPSLQGGYLIFLGLCDIMSLNEKRSLTVES